MAESTEAGARESIWQRLERPARPPRAALTHDQIATAAIEIADAEGLGAVSMRRLAERLGVATMGLYRYVRSRDDIVELMVDAAYAGKAGSEKEADWRTVVGDAAWGLRATILRHPWLIQATAVSSPLTPNMVAQADRLLASLDSLDLDADSKMAVIATVRAYVNGAAAGEVALTQLMRYEGATTMDDLRDAYASRMMWLLESDRYPAFKRYIHEGVRKDDAEWQFGLGLESVLDGLAARMGI
ncbi:TetR/AcrR family transcriptional regulator [Streptosporangium sp. NPDC000396]|uniref:TetR/AcrR family transcriptional regulator n=1 Tax=Streptosporangium sp. NPDC000396 TaxID=3366185 RepID=UPI00369A6E65